MTPINFTSFLFSLLLVDMRYSLERSHNHAEAPTMLPAWLHDIFYRPQPYQYKRIRDQGVGGRWFYHSKQKKLIKMEADEAFRMRYTVLLVIAVFFIAACGAAWYLMSRLYRHYLGGSRTTWW